MPTKVKAKKSIKKKAAAKKAVVKRNAVAFAPTKLKLRRPVPSDIEIAQQAKLILGGNRGIDTVQLEQIDPFHA